MIVRVSSNVQRLAADIMPMQDAIPNLLGRFGKPEKFAVFLIYDAFVDQEIEIDGLTPKALAHQDDRNRPDFACLNEREYFEQFVDGAIPARKRDQRLGSQEKMKLAKSEIVKVEAPIGGDVRVWILLMRQADVEADGFDSDVESTAIGRLHDSRSAPGHDDPVLAFYSLVRRAHQATEFAGYFLILALVDNTRCDCTQPLQILLPHFRRQGITPHNSL